MAWRSIKTLFKVPEVQEKRSNALSGPSGLGEALKRFLCFLRARRSFQMLYQVPEGPDKRSNALSGL